MQNLTLFTLTLLILFDLINFIHKMNGFSLNDSTNTGRVAKFFSCCQKTVTRNKTKHLKNKIKSEQSTCDLTLNDFALKLKHSFP